jgi:hypothetical protein
MLSKGLFTFPFCCFLLLSAQATPNRRYSFRLMFKITFRATLFLGSKVTDKERLHPLNHARVKDEISSVRFLVRKCKEAPPRRDGRGHWRSHRYLSSKLSLHRFRNVSAPVTDLLH